MANMCNELLGTCGFCRKKVKEGVMCDECNWWFHWECANTTASNLESDKPWYCILCKQVRKCKEQEEIIRIYRGTWHWLVMRLLC